MTAQAKIQASIVLERTYRASLDELWSLWTTKDGFESWWGPQGFRVDVHAIEAKRGGRLHYDMIAATPEAIAAMKEMGEPTSHKTRGAFTRYEPQSALELTHVIDFLRGVPHYESIMTVQFFPNGQAVRMVVTLSPMHDEATTGMQHEGFASQLTKLDERYAR